MHQSVAFLLIVLFSSVSFSFPDNYSCYEDQLPFIRRPILEPDACEGLLQSVLAQSFAQHEHTFGRVTAPGVLTVPLIWYGHELPHPTNCIMEINGIARETSKITLVDKATVLTNLEERCIVGGQHRGGRVSLGPDRVIRLMLYALHHDEYERAMKMRPAGAAVNGTGGGIAVNGSVVE